MRSRQSAEKESIAGEDERTRDVRRLSALRSRIGHEVVDELLEAGLLHVAPLSPEERACIDEILAWEPTIPPPERPPLAPDVERVIPVRLLSSNLPALLVRLGEGGSTEASSAAMTRPGTEASLVALAKGVYPAFVAASNPDTKTTGWHPVLVRSASGHADAVAAMKAEEGLRGLWEGRRLVTTFDRTDMRPYDPVELLLHGAWRLSLLRGDWSVPAFVNAVLEQLDRLRMAGEGRPVHVPVFFGFGNVTLTGPVSNASSHARPYRGSLQSWLLGESDRLDSEGGGIIAERSVPWALRVAVDADSSDGPGWPAGELSETDWSSFRRWGDSFATALGMSQTPLSLKPHELEREFSFTPVPRLRWLLTACPLYGARSFHFSQGWGGLPCPEFHLEAPVLDRADQLSAIDDASTRIAVSRLSAALETPRAWRDGLVDAVIAWEAMSGRYRDAVTLKVSAVMAHLAASPECRKQVRDRIRKIYGARSRVVHGGDAKVTAADRNAAILVGLVALRRLVDDFPHLLGCDERFEQLCLDGA